jgi:hypothetical protein
MQKAIREEKEKVGAVVQLEFRWTHARDEKHDEIPACTIRDRSTSTGTDARRVAEAPVASITSQMSKITERDSEIG